MRRAPWQFELHASILEEIDYCIAFSPSVTIPETRESTLIKHLPGLVGRLDQATEVHSLTAEKSPQTGPPSAPDGVSSVGEPVVRATAAKGPALEPVEVTIVSEFLDKQNFIVWAKIVTMRDGGIIEVQLFSWMTKNPGR